MKQQVCSDYKLLVVSHLWHFLVAQEAFCYIDTENTLAVYSTSCSALGTHFSTTASFLGAFTVSKEHLHPPTLHVPSLSHTCMRSRDLHCTKG